MEFESADEDDADGIEIEDNSISDPFFYDPVITSDTEVAFDVQGAQGNYDSGCYLRLCALLTTTPGIVVYLYLFFPVVTLSPLYFFPYLFPHTLHR